MSYFPPILILIYELTYIKSYRFALKSLLKAKEGMNVMRVYIKGDLDHKLIRRALNKVNKFIKVPKNIEIYFLDDIDYCNNILSTIHKHARASFKQICLVERSSFSYNHKDRNLIVIHIDKKTGILKNEKALVGLILHEIMHSVQVYKGEYKQIYVAFEEIFNKNKRLLNKLKYSRNKIKNLFNKVGYTSILLLKDLFSNSELIEKGYGHYLLEYYKNELRGKKTCPRPVFYDKFKEAAMKDPEIIAIAFEFEFSLLSILLPFQRYKTKDSLLLIKHINNCYELNIKEIARKCHELIYLYLNYFEPNKEFSKKFLNAIFNKVYMLLI